MAITARARDLGVALAILVFTGLIVARLGDDGGEPMTGVARAADGDTLTLDGHRIRLVGIDAPELTQTCRRDGGDWRCGAAARARLAELLRAGAVTCRGQGLDKYSRLLARCETPAGDVAERLVREGLAVAYGGYEETEALARAERAGLWGAEFDPPQAWRRMNGRPQEDRHGREPGFLLPLLGLIGLD